MFAIKWVLDSIVSTAVDTTKRTAQLAKSTVSDTGNDLVDYLKHIRDVTPEQASKNYAEKTADIVMRQNYRNRLKLVYSLEDLQQEIKKLRDEINTQIKSEGYLKMFSNHLRVKTLELKILDQLLQAKDVTSLRHIAEQELPSIQEENTATGIFLRHILSWQRSQAKEFYLR